MKKHKEYYYTTKKGDVGERNGVAPVQYYMWSIRNKKGESLQSSLSNEDPYEQQFLTKKDAEDSAKLHIDEHYY